MMANGRPGEALVIVLGSHRSGTSVTARALVTMGVTLSDSLVPPGWMNEKGFFEDTDILELNEEMLHFLDRNWASLSPINAVQVRELVKAGYAERAIALMRRKSDGHRLFGVKEPRMTMLIAFWSYIFDALEREVRCVVTLRNPASVAHSLEAVHGTSTRHAYYLWLSHMTSALHYAKGRASAMMDFDELIAAPISQVEFVAETLNLTVDTASLRTFAEEFMDPELRSSRYDKTDLETDPDCPSLVKNAYSVLCRLCSEPTDENWQWASMEAQGWCEAMEHERQLFDQFERAFRPKRMNEIPQPLSSRARALVGRLVARNVGGK